MTELTQTLEAQRAALQPHFKAGFLQRRNTVFQFHFEVGESFHLIVLPDAFDLVPGIAPNSTLSLYVDSHETCWGLIDGSYDGMRAFMEGKYRADGNIVLSQLLLYLFKSNDPTNIYMVQD